MKEMTCDSDHAERYPAAYREMAYRRGYQQGIAYIINMLRHGANLNHIEDFEQRISKWRFHSKSRRKKIQPPDSAFEIDREKRKETTNGEE